jgi:hypothetical protein
VEDIVIPAQTSTTVASNITKPFYFVLCVFVDKMPDARDSIRRGSYLALQGIDEWTSEGRRELMWQLPSVT